MKKIIRVVYYIRVSTEEQKLHGLSLSAQRMKLDEYAKEHDYKFIRAYVDEGVSGRKPIRKRPALQRMLKDSALNEFDLIIFIKLDRYFRSVAEYHECQKILDTFNISWTATEEKYDLTTANGRAFINMKLTIAELEADQGGERIKLVNDYKVKEGYALSGAQPFGWTLKKDGNHSRVVRDPKYEAIVYEALDHLETFRSVKRTIFYIYDKYDLAFTYKVLRNTFDTTYLYGYYRGNFNYCEPYITKERYDKIQAILKNNIREVKTRRIYLFSNLITCGGCGARMTGNYTMGKKHEYLYYRCNAGSHNKKCSNKGSIYENVLERYVLDHLKSDLETFIIETESKAKTKNKTDTPAQIKKLKNEMDRLNLMFQKNRISIDKYDDEYEKLEAKLKEFESIKKDDTKDISPLKQILNTDILSIYESLDRLHKRTFWQSIFKEIIITNESKIKGKPDRKIKLIFNDDFM